MGFADLKRNRGNKFDALKEKINSQESTNKNNDGDDFWTPTVDKKTNRATAVIRFLPAPDGEDMPYAKYWDHFFKGPKGYYVEKSLTTLGKDDPLSEYNSELWNTGLESNKKIVRDQKRRLNYVTNIFIIEDHGDPSNNGTVRKFKFGVKIWEKLNGQMNPDFPNKAPVNPFDLWDGANFNLCKAKKGDYWNYDDSTFDTPAPLSNDDKELKSIWEQTQSLATYTDPKTFKTYEELSARLNKILGFDASGPLKSNVSVEVSTTVANTETAETADVADLVESASSIDSVEIPDNIDDDLSLFDEIAK